MTKLTLTAIFAVVLNFIVSGQSAMWNDIPDPKRETQQIHPESYRTMTVDFESLKGLLLAAPVEGTDIRNSDYAFQLPTPDGGQATFKIVEESVMAPELQAHYPYIRSYAGLGTGDYAGANIGLDFTLRGFHAQILMQGNTYYIDPLSPDDLNTYIIYTRESFFKNNSKEMTGACTPEDIGVPQPDNATPAQMSGEPFGSDFPLISNGTQLRTYELALACTGEYAEFHGGTVPLVMSAMTTTMTRVNQFYKRELSLRMLMIANNDDLISLNPLTDGYSNYDGNALLDQNQTKTDLLVGSANYDIGHVLSTGGGGAASIGVVCNNSIKARGTSGSSMPIGDPFDIDYVCHEMGHQWSARHTFNNSCNGERSASSAYEPGSGSTIMSYAGRCAPNIQDHNSSYFHNHSLKQIINFSVTGTGNSCATLSDANNTPPTVTVPASGFSIPKSTPFELTGSAVDAEDFNFITLCWEQYDLGPATAPDDDDLTNPSENAPIFRSRYPDTEGTRVFPSLSDLRFNQNTIGELLPTYARNMTFKCTARDGYINGGVGDAEVAFDVAVNSGPFIVTYPSETSPEWRVGTLETITWDVANTTAPPVNCSSVDIYLSLNGGITFDILLAANTPNDGSKTIVVPEITTNEARIKIKAHSNIFFDISNLDFTIVTVPINDNICSAIEIACGDELSGTNYGASPSSLGEPSCEAGALNDVFYKFNAISGNVYSVKVSGNNYEGVLALYSGSCSGALTEIDCDYNWFFTTTTFTATTNQQIFIRTYDLNSNGGNFTIKLTCGLGNDDPCDAIPLTCGQSFSGTTVAATTSSIGAPSCSFGTAKDAFFKIDALAGVNYSVNVSGANYNGVLAAYTGNCDGTLTEIDCSHNILGANQTVDFSVDTDQTVLIQTFKDFGLTGGTFQIQVSCSDWPNDDPCDAIELYCGESYSGSSSGGAQSGIGTPSCVGLGSPRDVFFKFTALANTPYSVTVEGATYDGVLSAYTGSCSGFLTEIDCANDGFLSNAAETVNILVATEQEIIIRAYDYQTFGQSDYTITLHCPIPDNDDCIDAINLSVYNQGGCAANSTVGTTYGSTASDPDGCESDSPDVYYQFNSGINSEVIINLDAISAADLALSVFESSCSSSPIFCNEGTNQSPTIAVNPYTTYYIRVHSSESMYTGTFTICVEEVVQDLATVDGTITGWNSSCAARNVTVSFLNISTYVTYTGTTVLSTSGTFVFNTVDIPVGTYYVLVKVQGELAVLTENVVLSSGANSFSTVSGFRGDLNNDNVINVLDISAFSASYGSVLGSGSYNFLADLNCDGVINIFDVSILNAGFFQSGDYLIDPL